MIAAAALAGAACDDTTTTDTTSGSGSTSSSASSSASSSSAGSGSSSSSGTPCGNASCSAEEYCGFPTGECSGVEACHPLPSCTSTQVTCGCDGYDYGTPCDADIESGGIRGDGSCASLPGTFACSYEGQTPKYCDIGTEYCRVEPARGPYHLACVPIPATCPPEPTDCDCLMDACSSNYCGIDPALHSIKVLCPL